MLNQLGFPAQSCRKSTLHRDIMPQPTNLSVPIPMPSDARASNVNVRDDPQPASTCLAIWSALFVGAFAFLLASFPSRNSDVWLHLAAGRDFWQAVRGSASTALAPSATWLFDVTLYA